MSKIHNPHDKSFRQSLKNIEVAREFLKIYVPKDILVKIDIELIKFVDTSHIDFKLKEHLSDIVYETIMLDGTKGVICFLIEHQTNPLIFMPLKLLHYQIVIMENYLLLNPKATHLPIVFPIVFYNGTRKPYPFSLNILDLFHDKKLGLRTLIEPAHLIDISQISDEDLKKHQIIGLLEWSQKHIRDRNLYLVVEDLIELINNLTKDLDFSENLLLYIKCILYYIVRTANIEQLDEFIEKLHTIKLVGGVMGTLANKWLKEGEARGEARGEVIGILKNKKEIAIAMLKDGMDINVISKFTKLSTNEIQEIQTLI